MRSSPGVGELLWWARRNLSRDRDDEDAPAVAAWFDVEQNRDRARERCEGIEDSAQTLAAMVQSELQSDADVFLGGFSQGGALALYTALYSSLSHEHREVRHASILPPIRRLPGVR